MSTPIRAFDRDEAVGTDRDLVAMVRRRLQGTYELDPWGLDRDAALAAANLGVLRWRIDAAGLDRLPADSPALLVANRRLGWSEPAVAATVVVKRTGRFVRAAGGGDLDPVSGLFRRFGAIPARRDDVAAALRADQLVMVPTRREFARFRAGHLPVDLIEPAVRARVPVFPVAVSGREVGRRWQVTVGEAIMPPKSGGPRAVGQVAVGIAAQLSELLDAHRGVGLVQRIASVLPVFDQPPTVSVAETGEI